MRKSGITPIRYICVSKFPTLLQGSDRLTHGWGHTQRALSPLPTVGT